MKKLITLFLFSLLLVCHDARAVGETPVAQTGVRQDACITTNNVAAVNTAVTLTIAKGSGCIYITELDFTASEDGTGGTDSWTNLAFTTTNLGGWQYEFSQPTAAA